jgi:hypothetical protein
MNKFEKLIEYIINDDDQKARELFHSIVVEKSRDIYESIMDEEQVGEMVQGDQVGNMVDEIEGEESTMEGDDEFGGDMGGDDMGGEEEFGLGDGGTDGEVGGDMGGDEFGGDTSHEDTVMSIDAKLDELLAKFDEITGDGTSGSDEFDGGDEEGAEGGDDMGGDEEEVAADETGMMEGENPFAKSGKSGKSGSAVSGKSGSAVSGKSGSAKSGKSGKPFESKSTAQMMREYVDTIGNIYGGDGDASEGDAVGAAGKKTSINAKSTSLTSGPDFGGTSANIVGKKGATNENPDGKAVPKANNEYSKGQGEIKSGNVNVPGGTAGKSSFKKKEGSYEADGKGQGSETGKTVGSSKGGDRPSINKKSELGQAGQPTGKKQ